MIRLIAFLTFLSLPAYAAGLCLTPCGMLAQVSSKDICAQLRQAETRVVVALEIHARMSAAGSCEALKGWAVAVREPTLEDLEKCEGRSFWLTADNSDGGFCASGYTVLQIGLVLVSTEDFQRNALAHELIHALRGKGHCDWAKLGIKTAIQSVTGRIDRTPSDCDE